MNLKGLMLLVVSVSTLSLPTNTTAEDCGDCPAGGECPSDLSAGAADPNECPCPEDGECPSELVIGERILDMLAASQGLSDLAGSEVEEWASRSFPEPLLRAGQIQGQQFAVPVAAEASSRMWISRESLGRMGNSPPASLDDLLQLMRDARQQGIVPLAGTLQGWELRQLFQAVVATEGAGLYETTLGTPESESIQGEGFLRALRTFGELMADQEPQNGGDWRASLEQVSDGTALMYVTGSWANELYPRPDDSGLLCLPFPGAEGVLIYSSPVLFALGNSADVGDLDYAGSTGFSASFARANGLMSPEIEGFLPDCRALPDAELVPDLAFAAPEFVSAVEDALARLTSDASYGPEQAQRDIADAFSMLP
jgi:hypothetical protein